jgi:hypothetical protein
VLIRCQDDYKSFHKYKEGKLFDNIKPINPALIERKRLVDKIMKQLKNDLEEQIIRDHIDSNDKT